MASKKSAGATAWKIVVGILVALLIIILIAEFGLRWYLSNQLRTQFEETAQEQGLHAEEDPEVAFGPTPLLWGLASGTIGRVEVDTPSTLNTDEEGVISGQPASRIVVEDFNIRGNPVAGRLTTTMELPEDFLLAAIQEGIREDSGVGILGDYLVTNIATDSADASMDVEFGSGFANLTLRPVLEDGHLRFEATSSSVLGMELPEQASNAITNSLEQGLQDNAIGQMDMQEFTVLDGALRVTVVGTDVPLDELSDQFSGEQLEIEQEEGQEQPA